MNKPLVSIIGAACGALTVLLLHLFDFGQSTFISRGFANSMHAPAFGLLAIGLLQAFRPRLPPTYAYLAAATTAMFVGVLAELAQLPGPRDADFADLTRDGIGIAAFLCAAAALDISRQKIFPGGKRFLWRVLAISLLLIVALPPSWYAYVFLARGAAVPHLLSFESGWEREIYRVPASMPASLLAAPQGWPLPGRVARLTLNVDEKPALLFQPYRDWSNYSAFSFLAGAADGRNHGVYIRIHDRTHNNDYDDRFNRRFVLTPQPQRIRIPLTDVRAGPAAREMDIAAIQEVILFIYEQQNRGSIFVDDFRLEND